MKTFYISGSGARYYEMMEEPFEAETLDEALEIARECFFEIADGWDFFVEDLYGEEADLED